MSSISFPNGHLAGSTHPDLADSMGFYGGSSFDTSGSSSFQMNPLSSHPPRTPRTSTMGNNDSNNVYGVQVYASTEPDTEKEPMQEVEVDEEDERIKKRAARVRREAIWKEMLKTSVGRDKAFKVIQYGLKLYLLFRASLGAARLLRKPLPGTWDHGMISRLDTTISKLSLSRKCLILFDWLAPLDSILAQHTALNTTGSSLIQTNASKKKAGKPLLHSFLHAPPPVLLELVQSLADDVSTAAKLGILGGTTGRRAGRFAEWCLFASTLVNLVENAVERSLTLGLQHEVESRLYEESAVTGKATPRRRLEEQELQRLQVKDYWMKIQRTKLMMDLINVSYDVFRLSRGKRTVQTLTGLAAAILSTAKLYNTHKVKLMGTSS